MKTFSITFALGAVVLFASNVAAHGRFVSPPTRIAEGDENQGFTKTRGPTTEQPCAGVPFQGVKSEFSPGQTFPYSWEIGAAHQGTCFLELSTDDAQTFKTIKEDPTCADSAGTFNSEAQLPAGVTGKCVLRWRWEAKLTNELYLNCADINIGGGGGTGSDGTGSDGGTASGDQQPSSQPQPEPQPQPQPSDDPPTVEVPNGQPPTKEPSTAEPSPSTAEPSPSPSTAEPSTSTGEPSTGDPGCEKQPAQDGGDPQQPPADSNTGNTDANSGAKRYRRSAPRARPRRLRRSA